MPINLHGIVSGVISAINPNERVTYRRSLGSTTNADGSQTPVYDSGTSVMAQVQETTTDDLRKSDGLNLQGQKLKAWLDGSMSGVVRQSGRGGDLIVRADGSTWLVANIIEQWATWVAVLMVRQNP